MVTTRSAGPSSSSSSSLRRSARLSGSGTLSKEEFSRILQDKAQKSSRRPKRRDAHSQNARNNSESQAPPAKAERSQSVSVAPNDMFACREKALKRRERNLAKKEKELDGRQRNTDALWKDKGAEMTLSFLDDNLSCALCREILACPYTLTSATCGHSFCGICIMKWFFSRLHSSCGSWHENVACPFCRTPLVHTPPVPPRDLNSFPFTPNRLADSCIRSALEKLSSRSGPEGASSSKPANDDSSSQRQRGSRVKKEESVGLVLGSDINGWTEEGRNRKEWNSRNRLGHREMEDLRNRWPTLKPEEFAAIKIRLSV